MNDHDTNPRQAHRGIRRLSAGLPVRDDRRVDRRPTTIDQLTVALQAAIDVANDTESTLVVFRIRHRPLPNTNGRTGDRPVLHEAITERLSSINDLLIAVALSPGEIIGFVPALRRRADGDELLGAIVAALTPALDIEGLPHYLGPVVGAALLDLENPTVDDLLDGSSLAVDETEPSNPGMMFHPYQRVRSDRERQMAQDLRAAVLQNFTDVALQPSTDLATGDIVGIEVFARWRRNGRGQVPAVEFITLAEQMGLLHQLGRQVLERALFQVSDWVEAGLLGDVTLWVNMTPSEILHPQFAAMIAAAVKINPRVKVGIELTPMPPSSERFIHSVIRALVARGARAAIGDFGIGNVDISMLQQLPFDAVKLDRSLIRQIAGNSQAADLLSILIEMAKRLDMEVTAQGVESGDQIDVLRQTGCDVAQGFHIARPMSTEDFERYLTDRR